MKYLYTIAELKDCLGGQSGVAIYGAGDWGRRLSDFAIWEKLQDKVKGIIISEKKEGDSDQYRGIPIFEADRFLKHETCTVVIAVSWQYQEEILQVVKQYGNICYVIAQELYASLADEMDTRKRVSYSGINFLCPAFTKCGTSSLHGALMTIKDIYLSPKKESNFFSWHNDVQDAKEVLVDNYFNTIKEGQVVGMIEPTFYRNAKEVYEYFGSGIKLIFLVRNPIESTFSRFKMMLRGSVMAEAFYQKYDQFSMRMFDDYMRWNDGGSLVISRYIDWINEFRRYYSDEQIKIVYFEELIKHTRAVMNELLKFVESKHCYERDILSLVNEGNYVMADLESHRLARRYQELSLEYLHCSMNDTEAKNRCYSDRIKAYHEMSRAKKVYDVKILEEQKERLKKYYFDSVRELEDCFHKDLSDLWF